MEFDFSQNYFDVFALDVAYDIDTALLATNYQQLQNRYHPDKFVNGSDQERRLALQITSYLNKAYDALRDEQNRARYLLEMQNVVFDFEKDTTKDMQFLMDQMDLREKIDEADQADDPLETLDELASLARQQKKDLIKDFQHCFANSAWEEAKDIVLKMQFFTRLQQQINTKQEQLEEELL
jgi:molecular chaperone HscB